MFIIRKNEPILTGGMLMKKVIGIILGLTFVLLLVTNSSYVEWDEVYIMIGCLSAISIVYNLFSEERHSYSHILGSSALIGFFLSLALSLIDLALDHYVGIKGVPFGRALTLGEKISEFTDDLFIVALIVTGSVTLISSIAIVIDSKLFRRIE